jgi:hypothetical protein
LEEKTMKISTIIRRSTSVSLLSLLVACQTGSAGDEWLDGAPEQAAFQMQLSDDADAESWAKSSDMVVGGDEAPNGAMGGAPSDSVAPALREAREGVKNVNEALRAFLEPAVSLLREEPTETRGQFAVWGPVVRGATEYQVTLRKGILGRFGWLLEARPAGDDGEFLRVAAGRIVVDGVPRRGAGVAGFDLTSLGSVDPTVVGRGELLVGFAHGPRGNTVSYSVRDFTLEPDSESGIDARLRAIHLSRGVNIVRLAYRGNVEATPTDAEELVLARGRHRTGGGGRVDALITEGDVPEGKVLVKSQCYDENGALVYSVVRECTEGDINAENCNITASEGELRACLDDFRTESLPPSDPTEDEELTDDPNPDVTPPTSMPDGSAG